MSPNSSSPNEPGIVIVGAGQAGIEAAAALRGLGYAGSIVIIGEETTAPYSRPPLSKAYLAGASELTDLELRNEDFFSHQNIDLRIGATATAINRTDKSVQLADGSAVAYDHLILATGAVPRTLPDPAAQAANVLSLRTAADARRLREHLSPGARLVIVGGGYIGLEIGSAARRRGVEVTLLESQDRVLARVTSEPVSAFFQRIHAEEGLEIITGARTERFLTGPDGDLTALELADGRHIDVDVMLVGIGVLPRVNLAEEAGLVVDNGIVVDEYLRTSDPAIFAIGDVARHPSPQGGGLRRLESAPNASEQARVVAANVLAREQAYESIPWFWSDQYDLKLQSVGIAVDPDDVIVRETADEPRKITVLYLRNGALIAADVVNNTADFATAKRLVASGQIVDRNLLGDLAMPLKALLSRPATSVHA